MAVVERRRETDEGDVEGGKKRREVGKSALARLLCLVKIRHERRVLGMEALDIVAAENEERRKRWEEWG
jgi:hypothetical protein